MLEVWTALAADRTRGDTLMLLVGRQRGASRVLSAFMPRLTLGRAHTPLDDWRSQRASIEPRTSRSTSSPAALDDPAQLSGEHWDPAALDDSTHPAGRH